MYNILVPVLHSPSKPTGICRHASNLAQCLAEDGSVSSITLIIGSWQKDYFESAFKLDNAKISLVNVDIQNSSISRNWWFMFGLPKLAHQLQPNLIHMSFPFPFVRRWLPAPVISTIHDFYPYEYPENFGYPRVWFNRLFLRQCLRQSNGLVCVSQSTLSSFKTYFPTINATKQATVAYNFVDFSHVESIAPSQVISAQDCRFILCVAQHRKNKNLDLLIKAYYEMQERKLIHSTLNLFIVGSSGPETNSLISQIKNLKLQNKVAFFSTVTDEEICWLYKNCDVFVIPSSTEGFCLPLVEAIVLSPRVVCSKIPIFQEVGSPKCTYFELNHNSVSNLVDAVGHALSKPRAHNNQFDLRFSKSSVAQKLLEFYKLF